MSLLARGAPRDMLGDAQPTCPARNCPQNPKLTQKNRI